MGALKKFKFEDMLDMKAERFIWFYPAAGFLLIFVGIPLFILACVCICAAAMLLWYVYILLKGDDKA